MPRLPATIAAVLLAAGAGRAGAASPLHVEGTFFRDAAGGAVILRGINAAGDSKVPPFRPLTGPELFDPVRAWGMNSVRLLFTWEAYEPARGVYDESYLEYYARAVDAAGSRGLHVIVDFHQDAYSRYALRGCGEGFPAWTMPWWVIRATPDNGPGCWSWGAEMVFDIGMHLAWASFHDDSIGARSRYLGMVERVARRLSGNPAVVGYDLLNEPWGDEPTALSSLHRDAAAAVRRAHPSAILFLSPHALHSSGSRSRLPRPALKNVAYAPHFYDPGVILFKWWSGASLDGPFANMRGVAGEWGVPLFVGEFGAPAATANGPAYVHALYDGLDAALASGAQWVFTPGWTPAAKDGWNGEDLSVSDDTGATRANFVARPYPRRVSGTPTRFFVDWAAAPAARKVELEWAHDPATGATDVYVPAPGLFGTTTLAVEAAGPGLRCATAAADLVRCLSDRAGSMRVRITGGAPRGE